MRPLRSEYKENSWPPRGGTAVRKKNLVSKRTDVGQDVETTEPSCFAGKGVK